MSFFERIFEVSGFLRIMVSPLLIGLVIGTVIYFCIPNILGLCIGITMAAAGLFIGMIWALRIWKTKEGTHGYLSRTSTPADEDK